MKAYLDTCLIKLLTQQKLVTATLSVFSSLKSPKCFTKPRVGRVALDGNKLFQRQIICGFLGFIDNLEILFNKRSIET